TSARWENRQRKPRDQVPLADSLFQFEEHQSAPASASSCRDLPAASCPAHSMRKQSGARTQTRRSTFETSTEARRTPLPSRTEVRCDHRWCDKDSTTRFDPKRNTECRPVTTAAERSIRSCHPPPFLID